MGSWRNQITLSSMKMSQRLFVSFLQRLRNYLTSLVKNDLLSVALVSCSAFPFLPFGFTDLLLFAFYSLFHSSVATVSTTCCFSTSFCLTFTSTLAILVYSMGLFMSPHEEQTLCRTCALRKEGGYAPILLLEIVGRLNFMQSVQFQQFFCPQRALRRQTLPTHFLHLSQQSPIIILIAMIAVFHITLSLL
ncbi:hypothetical protein FGO68_gene11270 [Halteria grandinella]|uniref:Uncharacterized protein n=1 Tax=Halteria grandinella TaxID=5974 RepID=A0A8J8SVI9_HALGN|nr:hypothetical protein FGO68_gene11270 [Halteria grandinella]